MGKGRSIVPWLLMILVTWAWSMARADAVWQPSVFQEYKVIQSADAWAATPKDACDAFYPEAVALWVGQTTDLFGVTVVVKSVQVVYWAPDSSISPPGECRVLISESYNGQPPVQDAYQIYFFTDRGRFFWRVPLELLARLGGAPARENSHERDDRRVAEPIDLGSGNVYHAETVTVGSGPRAIRFDRSYNSQSTDAGALGANWRTSFSQRIDPTPQGPVPESSPHVDSGVYNTAADACSNGWYDIRPAFTGQPWAASGYARLDAATGRCVIFYNNGTKRYGSFPVSSQLTNESWGPGDTPVPEVQLVRPDGNRTTVRQVSGTWVDGDGVQVRLEEATDANGAPTGWTYTTGEKTVESYDATGRLLSVQAPDGITTTLTYDGSGNLTGVHNDAGYGLTFAYDGQNRISSVTDSTGRVWSYSYDANNNLAEVARPDGTARHYQYNDTRFAHALTDVIDARGIDYIHYAYDDQGRGILSTLAGDAAKAQIVYDDTAGTRTVTDGEGAVSTYTVTPRNNVPLITAVDGPACPDCGSGHYSAAFDGTTNELLSKTRNGITTAYGNYDAQGNPGYRIEASGTYKARRTDYTYDPRFLTKVTSASTASVASGQNKLTQYQYDDYGNLTQKTVSGYTPSGTAVSRTTTFAYNGPFHQLSQVDGPRTDVSDVTTYAYDAQGNLTQVTDALSHVTSIDNHDAQGRPLTITDPNGLVTHLAYDTLGRLTSRNAGGETTTFSYDAAGNLTRITLPDGSYLAYSYDGAGRLTGIADRLGDRIAYTLDTRGNRTEEDRYDPADTLTRSRSRVYNDLNQLIQDIGAQGQISAYEYDAAGNRNRETDPLNHATAHAFDALNRLVNTTDALGHISKYAYDNQDNVTQVTDPKGNATTYVYDDLGNRLETDSPDSGVSQYSYDAAGNVTAKTDAKGNPTHYTYDALNRLTSVTYADGSTAAYTYDTAPNGIGRLAAISDSTGRTSWSYDLHGRVTEKQETIGSITLTTQYTYDTYGRRIEMVYPSGNRVDYTYDADGRISAITINGKPLLSGIQYRPFGPVNAWTWGNGTPYSRQYDLDGRLTTLTMPSGPRTVSYDAASRITGLSDPDTTMTFSYDNVDRLTQVSGGPQDQAFQYDRNGNRTKLTEGSGATTYTYASGSNRLTGQSGAIPKTYTYDANGSITGDGAHTYTYDTRNRLVSVDSGADTYAINALGQRVRKVISVAEPPGDANGDGMVDSADFDLVLNIVLQQATATGEADCNRDNQINVQDLVCINESIANGGSQTNLETDFAYDGQGELIGEYDTYGNPLEETVYLQGMPVATIQSHTIYYVYSDHLGTPRAITDTANVTLWRWESTPFGETAPNEDPDGDGDRFTYNLRFPGQYYDQETGLQYNYFRDYDPTTGAYVESDPVGLLGGLNTYIYAKADPSGYSDASGRNPLVVLGALIGGISGTIQAANSGGGWTSENAANIIAGAVSGAVVGGLAGLVPTEWGALATVATGAAAGGGGSIVGQVTSRIIRNYKHSGACAASELDWQAVGVQALLGGSASLLGFGVGLRAALSEIYGGTTSTEALAVGERAGAATSGAAQVVANNLISTQNGGFLRH